MEALLHHASVNEVDIDVMKLQYWFIDFPRYHQHGTVYEWDYIKYKMESILQSAVSRSIGEIEFESLFIVWLPTGSVSTETASSFVQPLNDVHQTVGVSGLPRPIRTTRECWRVNSDSIEGSLDALFLAGSESSRIVNRESRSIAADTYR